MDTPSVKKPPKTYAETPPKVKYPIAKLKKNKRTLENRYGQIIIFHQPTFPWNKEMFLPQLPFAVKSCEVAIIWLTQLVIHHDSWLS